MTEASIEDTSLARIFCIHYPVQFRKDSSQVQALFNSESEVNAMNPAYASKLGFRVHRTDIEAREINGSTFETFGMVLASFQVKDKLGRIRLF